MVWLAATFPQDTLRGREERPHQTGNGPHQTENGLHQTGSGLCLTAPRERAGLLFEAAVAEVLHGALHPQGNVAQVLGVVRQVVYEAPGKLARPGAGLRGPRICERSRRGADSVDGGAEAARAHDKALRRALPALHGVRGGEGFDRRHDAVIKRLVRFAARAQRREGIDPVRRAAQGGKMPLEVTFDDGFSSKPAYIVANGQQTIKKPERNTFIKYGIS